MEDDLKEILSAGLVAADPKEAVLRSVRLEEDAVISGDERFEAERIFVLAAGKAAGPMAGVAEELFGDRIAGGLVVTKDEHEAAPGRLETIFAAHPEPDERGMEAARRTEELVEPLQEGDLLLALISGASALLADPAPHIELEDLERLTGELLRSGANIAEINAVRKHVSALKGGGLVRLTTPARTLALLLSDVVGDDPSSIASGLTAPDPTTLDDAQSVLRRYDIKPPESISAHLESRSSSPSSGRSRPSKREATPQFWPLLGRTTVLIGLVFYYLTGALEDGADETPKPGDDIFEGVANVVCGGGRHAAEAAVRKARDLGYAPLLLSTTVTGDAQCVASVYAAVIREVLETGNPVPPPCALVSGGEATVTVRGEGTGGPNQEFALALAAELEGVEGWAAFAVDTDGPTDAAGGSVTGATAGAIRENGVDLEEALANNDAYAALKAGGALLVTGPTGTNVNDLRVALVTGSEGGFV